jgi:non-lysosomal glucosylceramidase
MPMTQPEFTVAPWPMLTTYDQEHLLRIALPLGGIGTGTVSLGGRGNLRDWELANRPAKGFTPMASGVAPCFVLRTQAGSAAPVTRLLEGPLDAPEYEGASGSPVPNHGLPRFRQCSFAAAYPFAQVRLADPEVPLTIRLEAYNPLIPGDAERSGLPFVQLRYVLENPTGQPVSAAIAAVLPNFIGADGSAGMNEARANRNTYRQEGDLAGLFLASDGVPCDASAWGTLALAVVSPAVVTWRTAWRRVGWGASLLDFWEDFAADGRLDERPAEGAAAPVGSLAVQVEVPPGETRAITFLLAWHFPNRYTWTPAPPSAEPADTGEACVCGAGGCGDGRPANPDCIGNYYTTRFRDAWDVVREVAPQLPELERETLDFVTAFLASDLPHPVKEAALFNLSSLRSQTCFRTPDGRFYGWEGCGDKQGCCHGSCTHVWNYEQATAFLFGDLARTMREVEFAHATDARGLMSFRVHLPIARGQEFARAAADGQMGCIMKMYRDWQLSGDEALLRDLWPHVRRALEFCWVPGGWDADRDGVMEGCQHNTMDVEYFGPNPQMGIWYLGALRAAEEMAIHLGEDAYAAECRDLLMRGSAWLDAHLFNGEYYEHQVWPPQTDADGQPMIADGLLVGMGTHKLGEPEYQLGAGCLVDQLVGQFMAHVCGLGYLVDPSHVSSTLASILKYNRRQGFEGHFNCMRSYVLGDESALLMASYPTERPANPFPYFTEVMTGFEYTAAVGMLYEGMTAEGLGCISDIRARYDGRKRSPFDEAECGHHYSRAMASWAAVLALTGFHYSAVTQTMTFAAQPGQHFWSNGSAWGTCVIQPDGDTRRVELAVLHGTLRLRRLQLTGWGAAEIEDAPQVPGSTRTVHVDKLQAAT